MLYLELANLKCQTLGLQRGFGTGAGESIYSFLACRGWCHTLEGYWWNKESSSARNLG